MLGAMKHKPTEVKFCRLYQLINKGIIMITTISTRHPCCLLVNKKALLLQRWSCDAPYI